MYIRALAASGLLALSACGAPTAEDIRPLRLNVVFDAGEIAQDLSQAIQYRTISSAFDPRASWDEFERFRAFLAERFPRMHAELNPQDLGDGQLLFTWAGSNADVQPIVLLAHQDVVPIEPGTEDQWSYPPFDGTIADGFVWGRGTLDMKGHLIALLHAVERHLENGTQPERTIYISLVYYQLQFQE